MSTLLILCTVCSCNKKSDEHPNEGSILRMNKFTYGDGTAQYAIYDRDANNRIVAMRDSSKTGENKIFLVYGSNGKLEKALYSDASKPTFWYDFEYNSAGRLSKMKTHPGTQTANENYYIYTYDAAGHLIADSLYTESQSNNITTYKLFSVNKYMYTGNNITEGEKYESNYGALALKSRFKYEYDNGINPLASNEYEYYLNNNIWAKSANNVLKAYFADGNLDYHLQTTFSYKYNSGNFAWKASAKDVTNGTGGVYEYFYQ